MIGITGSAGKTTTKDFCTTLLENFGPSVASLRSLNYRLSAAETILRMRWRHKFCILELSGGRPNTLDLPLRIARPHIGVLTVIGRDHYSAFKSKEAIAAEKGKIVKQLPRNGIAVLNIDDPQVRTIGENYHHRKIWVGRDAAATLRLLKTQSNWPEPLQLSIEYEGKTYDVHTQLHGEHLALSVLCALGVACALEIPLDEAIPALMRSKPVEGRMQVLLEDDGVVFVRDDWKAPHWSIESPLSFLKSAKARRKIAVFGTISDSNLGPSKRYPQIARSARECSDLAVFIGPDSNKALKARSDPEDESIRAFPTLFQASSFLDSVLQPGDLVLIKGTNLQDHLLRLVLNRRIPISCWRPACKRHGFCDTCDLLYSDVPTNEERPLLRGITGDEDTDYRQPNETGTTLIVGLGNPGEQYSNTPHNLGYATLDLLVLSFDGSWNTSSDGSTCQLQLSNKQLLLFKPNVPINLSGTAVRKLVHQLEGEIGSCIAIHDDLDLNLGEVKFDHVGGHSAHKGILSIVNALGTTRFERLRVGGRLKNDKQSSIELVLQPFTDTDRPAVTNTLHHAVEALINYLGQAQQQEN